MLISEILLNNQMKETILYDVPTFRYSMYVVEYDHYFQSEVPWHWHDELELIYVARGSCNYRTRQQIYKLSAGDAIFLKPGVLHMLRPLEEGTVTYASLFDRIFLAGEENGHIDRIYLEPVLSSRAAEAVPFFHGTKEADEILSHVRMSAVLAQSRPRFYELDVRRELSEIWKRIYERSAVSQEGKAGYEQTEDDRFKKILLYLEEHYAEPLSPGDMADTAHISERECFRLFRRQVGVTPGEFLTNYRVGCAKSMLMRQTDRSITDIALACGFSNNSHFAKIFRDRVGLSPREFRRKYLEMAVSEY